ncbi:hypothetical protein [Runella sp.]|uniref:hypothetical protein n=1 Tax=Runella sp. TaxID=1960881 RepID=UPI003D11851E
MAVMEHMKDLVAKHNQGQFHEITEKPESLKTALETNIAEVMNAAPELRKALLISTPKPHPTTPRRRYVGLIWDTKERTVLLCQITYVLPEGGEYGN